MKLYKIILFCLCLCVGITIEGKTCKKSTKKSAKTESVLKDGKYTGKGEGYNGPIKVLVTVTKGKVSNVSVLSSDDDYNYLQDATDVVVPQIIKEQNTHVDGATGATYSSNGIKSAVANALKKAKK